MKNYLVLLFLVCINSNSLYSQNQYARYLTGVKSPEASSLSQFGQIPVSLFNGTVNIEIPVIEIECGDIKIPVKLRYNSMGHRPSLHPGWLGLGWEMDTGGILTRQVNNVKDEKAYVFPRSNYGAYWDFAHGQTTDIQDKFPDAFNFSVNGLSGSFYMNANGEWKVKSKENRKFTVEATLTSNYNIYAPVSGITTTLPRVFTKFVITTDDGTQYTFGNDARAMEFSIPALINAGALPDPPSYPAYLIENPPEYEIEVNTWYLKTVVSPKGRTLTYNYETGNYLNLNQHIQTQMFYHDTGNPNDLENNAARQVAVSRHYLSEIVTDNLITYTFSTSLSNELPRPYLANNYANTDFNNFFYSTPAINFTYCKLDTVIAKYNGSVINKTAFDFIHNSGERLKLKTVRYLSATNNELSRYKLEYNSKPLPSYDTGKEDHWGFYNGKPLLALTFPPNQAIGDAYFQSREPDSSFVNAEIIKKITYPTGGSSQFEFEAHQYGSQLVQFPSLVCNPTGVNKVSGGLRIKRIINRDTTGILTTREFLYVKNYQSFGTTSSGILSGVPIYYQQGNVAGHNFRCLNSQELNYLNTTNGNHITYSEVVERESGNGYTITKYSNQDNGYMDRPAFSQTVITPGIEPCPYLYKSFGSLELERGLPLSKSYYKNDNVLLREESFLYNDDPNRFQDYVNVYAGITLRPNFFIYNATYPLYTYYPFLKRTVVKDFSVSTPVETTNDFQYDTSLRLLKSKTMNDSKAIANVTEYVYPRDYVVQDLDDNGVYNAMVNKSMTGIIIEENNRRGGVLYSSTVTEYGNPMTGLFLPKNIYTLNTAPVAYDLRYQYEGYDSKANPVVVSDYKGPKTCYKWGHNQTYVVAEIKNSKLNDWYVQDFEESNDYEANLTRATDKSHTGKFSGVISNVTNNEAVSHSSNYLSLTPGNARRFTYSGWIYSGGPSAQLFLFMYRAGETNYFSYVDAVGTSQTNKWVYLNKTFLIPDDVVSVRMRLDNNETGTIWYDDLSIRPADALLKTYTYQPLVGMTSEIDVNGKTTYYQYDEFQRLKYIRDQNNNIIKSNSYHYKN